jgi:hypothetical protein
MCAGEMFLLFCIFLLAHSVSAIDVASERSALIHLFNATNGRSWTTNSNWLNSSASMCSWFGVDCVCTGSMCSVAKLVLPNNNLVGTLPESVGRLTLLTVLNLNTNAITGFIPQSISNLTSLTYVDFGVREFIQSSFLFYF